MSIKRQVNFLGQERVDVPDLRSIESSVSSDFDDLAGKALAGKAALVIKGLTLSVDSMIGQKASSLQLNVAGSVIFHYLASESGTVFTIDDNATAQQLTQTNSNINGFFVNSAANYVGIDLFRSADSSTIDTKQFLDPTTSTEISQDVPLARTLQYKIIISTTNFSATTNVLPIAIVNVDGSGLITGVTDARKMMLGLASGGDTPSVTNKYSWGTRVAVPPSYVSGSTLSPFNTEEKNFGSIKGWMDAMMTSLWEIRGGDSWFSNQIRDNVKLRYSSSVTSNGDNLWFVNGFNLAIGAVARTGSTVTVTFTGHPFQVNGLVKIAYAGGDTNFVSGTFQVTAIATNTFTYTDTLSTGAVSNTIAATINDTLAWKGLRLLFENSGTAFYYNIIADGNTVIVDGNCLYVDLDRSQNATLTPVTLPLTTLGSSALPGRRMIIAWRDGSLCYSRERAYEVGRTFQAATTTSLGLVVLNQAPGTIGGFTPVVPALGSNGGIALSGIASGSGLSIGVNTIGVGISITNSGSGSGISVVNSGSGSAIVGVTTGGGLGGAFAAFTNSAGVALSATAYSNNYDALLITNGDIKLSGSSGESRLMYSGNGSSNAITIPTKISHSSTSDMSYSSGKWNAIITIQDSYVTTLTGGGSPYPLDIRTNIPQGVIINSVTVYYGLQAGMVGTATITGSVLQVYDSATFRDFGVIATGGVGPVTNGTGATVNNVFTITPGGTFTSQTNGYIKLFLNASLSAPGTDTIIIYGARINYSLQQLTGVLS